MNRLSSFQKWTPFLALAAMMERAKMHGDKISLTEHSGYSSSNNSKSSRLARLQQSERDRKFYQKVIYQGKHIAHPKHCIKPLY